MLEAAVAAQKLLEEGTTLAAGAAKAGIELEHLRELTLMTSKPFIYVFNVDEDGLSDEALQAKMRDLVAPADAIFLNAKLESD